MVKGRREVNARDCVTPFDCDESHHVVSTDFSLPLPWFVEECISTLVF